MFEFKVNVFSVDSSGYFRGEAHNMEVTVYTESEQEAVNKAINIRGTVPRGRHDAWRARVISAKEIIETQS